MQSISVQLQQHICLPAGEICGGDDQRSIPFLIQQPASRAVISPRLLPARSMFRYVVPLQIYTPSTTTKILRPKSLLQRLGSHVGPHVSSSIQWVPRSGSPQHRRGTLDASGSRLRSHALFFWLHNHNKRAADLPVTTGKRPRGQGRRRRKREVVTALLFRFPSIPLTAQQQQPVVTSPFPSNAPRPRPTPSDPSDHKGTKSQPQGKGKGPFPSGVLIDAPACACACAAREEEIKFLPVPHSSSSGGASGESGRKQGRVGYD